MNTDQINRKALEKAAKYICESKCGLCPFVLEKAPCPVECTEQTLPWQCWVAFFKSREQNN